MKKFLIGLSMVSLGAFAQDHEKQAYKFETITQNKALEVCSQGITGTCWSFSTASFLESEMERLGHGKLDLSEMFIVKNVYKEKALNYVNYHGKTNFGEGSLAHDYLNAAEKYGLMTYEAFPGRIGDERHDHREMASVLEAFVKAVVGKGKISKHWKAAYAGVLDAYLGADNTVSTFNGKKLSAMELKNAVSFSAADYITLTSFTHHPFEKDIILELPDNWSNGFHYNMELDALEAATVKSLKAGYTLVWDADVSNKGFSSQDGLAIVPEEIADSMFVYHTEEMSISQEYRQEKFEDQVTTDDHLMHITGLAKDQNGKTYFLVKNSWGTERGREGHEGYLFVSPEYFRLNTIAVTVHKSALEQK